MNIARSLRLVILVVVLFILVGPGCSKNDESQKPKDGSGKAADLIVGKWQHNGVDNVKIDLEFTADHKVTGKWSTDGSGPSLNGTYQLVEEHTLEMPKFGGPAEEKVKIDSVSKDKLVLSGFSYKAGNHEFTRLGTAKTGGATGSKKEMLLGHWVVEKGSWPVGATLDVAADGTMIGLGKNNIFFYKFKVAADEMKLTRTLDDGQRTWTIKELTKTKWVVVVKEDDNALIEFRKGQPNTTAAQLRERIVGFWKVPKTKEFPIDITYHFAKNRKDAGSVLTLWTAAGDKEPKELGSMKYDLVGNKIKLTRKEGPATWELLMLAQTEMVFKDDRGNRMAAKRK